jgi:hypothetical protein
MSDDRIMIGRSFLSELRPPLVISNAGFYYRTLQYKYCRECHWSVVAGVPPGPVLPHEIAFAFSRSFGITLFSEDPLNMILSPSTISDSWAYPIWAC